MGDPIESHTIHSDRLMRHAWEQLEKGDRLQASEKAWGAVAHQLKVVANARGWRYETHRDVYDIKDRVAALTDDPTLVRALFSTANGLHRNYYIDAMPVSELKSELNQVERLLDILNDPDLVRRRRRLPRALIIARDRPHPRGEMSPR